MQAVIPVYCTADPVVCTVALDVVVVLFCLIPRKVQCLEAPDSTSVTDSRQILGQVKKVRKHLRAMPVTLVFDNGAGSLKAGMAGELRPSHTMPNCTAKLKGQTQVRSKSYSHVAKSREFGPCNSTPPVVNGD